MHLTTIKYKMNRVILFVPSNSSHVSAQLPVAEELQHRGFSPVFLSRDSLINAEYRIEAALADSSIPVYRFSFDYISDFSRLFPQISSYLKLKADMARLISNIKAEAVVVCNDDAALFERTIIHLFRQANKPAFLIQESVRPANRSLPVWVRWKEQSTKEILQSLLQEAAFPLRLGPFFRKGYAHSNYSQVFTAGDMFRQRLLEEGVDESRIRVTGQPRLDGNVLSHNGARERCDVATARVLLFCNQPVKCSREAQDRLFLDLVETTDSMEGVQLLVKLHPRDEPESHWLQLLQPGQGQSLLEVTRTRPLADCFEVSDAFMTIASTTCLEAMDYGLPVGLIDYLPIEWYLPYSGSGAVVSVQSRSNLKTAVTTLLFDEPKRQSLQVQAKQVLHNELYLRDGKSAWRIANYIESTFA